MEIVADGPFPAGPELLEDQGFVWGRVWPLVSCGESTPPRSRFELAVHRRREDGRAVAEYSFEGFIRVFAKLYPDAAMGRRVYRIHESLCQHGFGPRSHYRVPEPVAYLDEHGVLLLRPSPGDCLAGLETHDREAFEDGVTRAARWLVALHASPLRPGPGGNFASDLFRLARRAAKAAACRPDLTDGIRDALTELGRRCPTAAEPSAFVPTHGRFNASHAFVASRCITAIDLDRAALADPAKDVGEFLHGLRSIGAKTGIVDDAVEHACEAFLGEYVRHRPAVLSELAYYWSYSVLWTLLGLAFKDRPSRRGWRERIEFFRGEFDAVPRRAAPWLGG
jgi:Phosphotransferase enzyme family